MSEGWKAFWWVVAIVIGAVFVVQIFRGSSSSDTQKYCGESGREIGTWIGHASNGEIGRIETILAAGASAECIAAWNNHLGQLGKPLIPQSGAGNP